MKKFFIILLAFTLFSCNVKLKSSENMPIKYKITFYPQTNLPVQEYLVNDYTYTSSAIYFDINDKTIVISGSFKIESLK